MYTQVQCAAEKTWKGLLLCEPRATTTVTAADEMNFQQEMQFEGGDMKQNYQELIKFLNEFYSNKTKKIVDVLEPDENDIKQPGEVDDNLDGDAEATLSQGCEYCIYSVDNGKYQRVVKGQDKFQVNEMIQSGILMNKLQLSSSMNSEIKNSQDLAKCFRDCNECILYVSILPKYYLFVKYGSINFKWVPTQLNQDTGSSDNISWNDEFIALKKDICEKFNL